MTLSKQQVEIDKLRWRKYFWIHERDLLWMAQRYTPWRELARGLGFTDEKVNCIWPHADAGRLINYMENPWFTANQT